ncbi:GH3 auxin-responsive promoter family protein [Pseudomonas viridiflava]|uniref:Auxin-responsive GH3-related protein n=2 Tax=Pseudomonas viridiflava TaxID=33069 RepID=A0A3M5PKE1_PSEVI|nr:GH3 auxin-responsive promoter family protein [Pseudomonas viridiflava]RMT84573.1 Auxin-responsive GH3-related protein [Pseudomonas viridiflava]
MRPANQSKRALWRSFADGAQSTLDHWHAMFEEPELTQQRILQRLLAANRDSAFGRAHEFASITDSTRFREQVATQTYAQLAPWIQRAQRESGPILTREAPLFFERTSGSSAVQKHIPYTRSFLGELQGALTVWLADMHRQIPEIGDGSGYWSMSPPMQAQAIAENGIAIGSTSDLAYLEGSAIASLAGTLLMPDLVEDATHWRRQTLLALVAAEDLSFISVWSPTFLTSLLQPLFDVDSADNRHVFDWVETQLPAERQQALRHARATGVCTRLWPRLAAVSCWMDGPSHGYATRLASHFPHARWLPKGLLATEGVLSIPVGAGPGCPLAIGSHYLEFLDENGSSCGAHSLRMGETVQVLLTTGSGLYRYALGDRVRVVGHTGRTPRVEFIGRAANTCDLVGEKLDEPFVERILQACLDTADDACLVADAQASPARYTVLLASSATGDVNGPADAIDRALQASFHYAQARKLGQLGPVCVRVVSGGAQRLAGLLQRASEIGGIRAGDVKPGRLISRLETARALLALMEKDL